MQSVKILFLVLLTFSLLSCETTKTEKITTGNGKASLCGDTLVGVTTEKREFEVAGATLKDFSLGKLNTNVTPEFQKIASEAALHEDSRVKIACRAMEMSGVKASPEMFTYYLQLLGFLSSSPSVEKRMEWAEKFPVPKIPQLPAPNSTNSGAHGSVQGPQESLSERLIRTCNQPVDGLNRQPQEFVPIWLGPLRQLHHEKFPAQRDLQTLYNIKSHLRDRYNTPEDFFQESLYTLKCLMDAGEIISLEKTGTKGSVGNKVFENQRIIFP